MNMVDTGQTVRARRSPVHTCRGASPATLNVGRTTAAGMSSDMTRSRVAFAVIAAFALVFAACSDDDDNEVSAEFTGDGCVYSGPDEFEVGDEFEITVIDVTEERTAVGFGVLKVPDGTSVTEVAEKGIEEVTEDEVGELDGTFAYAALTEEGTERVITTTLDVAGTWLVHCFDLSSPEGGLLASLSAIRRGERRRRVRR
jgi:hypothetical protein